MDSDYKKFNYDEQVKILELQARLIDNNIMQLNHLLKNEGLGDEMLEEVIPYHIANLRALERIIYHVYSSVTKMSKSYIRGHIIAKYKKETLEELDEKNTDKSADEFRELTLHYLENDRTEEALNNGIMLQGYSVEQLETTNKIRNLIDFMSKTNTNNQLLN